MFAALVQELSQNQPPSSNLTKRKRRPGETQAGVQSHPHKRTRANSWTKQSHSSLARSQPNLATLPGEVRNRIYQYLFIESSIRIHHYAEISDTHGSITYTQPDISLGRVFATFNSRSPNSANKRSQYALLTNGTHGITLTSRLIRAETQHWFLTHTTFVCPDARLLGVFCTHIPATWKPHIRFFSGWIAGPYLKVHDTLPTDREKFPGLKAVNLTVPKWKGDDGFAMLLDRWRDLNEAETMALLCTLRPYGPLGTTGNGTGNGHDHSGIGHYEYDDDDEVEEDGDEDEDGNRNRQGNGIYPEASADGFKVGPVDVFMLMATRKDIAWTVERDVFVVEEVEVERKLKRQSATTTAIVGETERTRRTTRAVVEDLGRFTIIYSSLTDRTTRHLRFLQRNHRLIEPGAAMLARWDLDGSYVGPLLRDQERRMLERWGRQRI